jgi:excisionase family DNA binding protein
MQSFAADRLWTVDEIAGYLQLSRTTVLRRIRSGELVALRIGNTWRVRQDDLDAFLASLPTSDAARSRRSLR